MNYDVNYFIKKFEAIPEKLWCIKKFKKVSLFSIKSCAQGHCMTTEFADKFKREMVSYPSDVKLNPEWWGLVTLFGGVDNNCNLIVAVVNNGVDGRYQQPTPKQRILAALYDIRDKQARENPKSTITLAELLKVKPMKFIAEDEVLETENISQN